MFLALRNLFVLCLAGFYCIAAFAQEPASVDQPPAILPLESESQAKIIAYPPLAGPLARGVVIIQYRTEHARIMPVFAKSRVTYHPVSVTFT